VIFTKNKMNALVKVSIIFTFTKQKNTNSVLTLAQENVTNYIKFLCDSLNYMCRSQSQSFPTSSCKYGSFRLVGTDTGERVQAG